MPNAELAVIVESLSRAFSGKAWHGPTLTGALRGVTPERAQIVPRGLSRSIWGQVLHAAYWKYAGCLRVVAAGARAQRVETGEGFGRSPSNWPAPPRGLGGAALEKAWRADLKLLKDTHAALLELVGTLDPGVLDRVPPGGRNVTPRVLLVGLAAHDAYHTGQIRLIKRLTA
jgi:hypothetical protein